MTTRSVPWVIAGALSACSAPRHVPDAPATAPFTMVHGLIFVDLDWPGRGPVLALLDTGANASAVDHRCAQDLPSSGTSTVLGTTGTLDVDMVVVEGLRLQSRRLPALRATRRDLAGMLAPEGRALDMILGSDALADLVLTIDFEAGRLELAEQTPEAIANGAPMILDDGIPAIEGHIGGIDVSLRIDTGASLFETPDVYVNIPSRTWQALRSRHRELTPSTYFKGTGADGTTVDLPVARVPDARVGPLRLDSVFVIVQPETGYFADRDALGFVGNNFLRQFERVTLDYRNGRLRPGK